VLEVCLRSTSSTPQAHLKNLLKFDFYLFLLFKNIYKNKVCLRCTSSAPKAHFEHLLIFHRNKNLEFFLEKLEFEDNCNFISVLQLWFKCISSTF